MNIVAVVDNFNAQIHYSMEMDRHIRGQFPVTTDLIDSVNCLMRVRSYNKLPEEHQFLSQKGNIDSFVAFLRLHNIGLRMMD